MLSLSEVLRHTEVSEPSASPDTSRERFFKCWHCDLPFEPTAVGVQVCSCSAGVHVRFPSVAQASICRADVSQLGASPQGWRPPHSPSNQSDQLDDEFVHPRVVGRSSRPPSRSQLTGPKFFHPSMTDSPEDCKTGRVCREPIAPFLEKHGSSCRLGIPSWSGMLNLSAYKALHPTWDFPGP